MIVLEMKTCTLSGQIITEDIRNIIMLNENVLIWDTEFYCDEINDKTELWEKDVYHCFYSRFKKSGIEGVQVSNSDEEDGKYYVDIFLMSGHKLIIYFEKEIKAREIADKIAEWLFA